MTTEYVAFVLNKDQIAVSFNIKKIASTIWFSGDPNDDLLFAGEFQSIAIFGTVAYLTTQDSDTEASGLWYCSNTLDLQGWTSGVVWTLVISAYDAAANADNWYTAANPENSKSCRFGAIAVNGDGEFCIPLHSQHTGFTDRVGSPGSGVYIGEAGSLTHTQLGEGQFGAQWLLVHPTFSETLHCVGHDGSNWHIACTAWDPPNWEGRTAEYDGAAWGSVEDYFPTPDRERSMACVGGVYATGGTGASAGLTYQNFDKGSPLVGVQVQQLTGIFVGATTHYLYTSNADTDKLYQDGLEIADAPTEFDNVNATGGTAEYGPDSDTEIFWVLGSELAFAATKVVLRSDDNGAIWTDETGNLPVALGSPANWSGFTANVGNALIRTTSYEVPFLDRTVVVGVDDRDYTVPVDDREYLAPVGGGRIYTVEKDDDQSD